MVSGWDRRGVGEAAPQQRAVNGHLRVSVSPAQPVKSSQSSRCALTAALPKQGRRFAHAHAGHVTAGITCLRSLIRHLLARLHCGKCATHQLVDSGRKSLSLTFCFLQLTTIQIFLHAVCLSNICYICWGVKCKV